MIYKFPRQGKLLPTTVRNAFFWFFHNPHFLTKKALLKRAGLLKTQELPVTGTQPMLPEAPLIL